MCRGCRTCYMTHHTGSSQWKVLARSMHPDGALNPSANSEANYLALFASWVTSVVTEFSLGWAPENQDVKLSQHAKAMILRDLCAATATT